MSKVLAGAYTNSMISSNVIYLTEEEIHLRQAQHPEQPLTFEDKVVRLSQKTVSKLVNKGIKENKLHLVEIFFTDGQQSLLSLEEDEYTAICTACTDKKAKKAKSHKICSTLLSIIFWILVIGAAMTYCSNPANRDASKDTQATQSSTQSNPTPSDKSVQNTATTATNSTTTTTTTSSSSSPTPSRVVDPKSKISKDAIIPMTQKGYPKTYKAWGSKYIQRMNKELMPKAALLVAHSAKCDRVISVDLSDNRSTPKKEAVFFVDCENGERFYVSENDIKKNTSAKSIKEAVNSYDESSLIRACEQAVKAKLSHPSTFDRSIFSTDVGEFPGGFGKKGVQFNFSAKNSYNLEVEMKAQCSFDDRGLYDVRISEL